MNDPESLALSHAPAITFALREVLVPCPFQPRKNFAPGPLAELRLNIAAPQPDGLPRGIIQPLIVRPVEGSSRLEIICGERRWRASEGVLAELPVIVRVLTDREALMLMLAEMQRAELSEVEECDAYAAALAQGETVESLSAKLGVGVEVIKGRILLRKLPAEGRKALQEGTVSYGVMRAVCCAPAALVARLVDVVLHPRKYPVTRMASLDAPLTQDDVAVLIDQESKRLDHANFSLEDADLVPVKFSETGERLEGGACVGCVHNTASNPAESGRRNVTYPRCLNAGCFIKKRDVASASDLVKARERGETVLRGAEAETVLRGGPTGGPSPRYVEIEAVLEEDEKAPNTPDGLTWGAIVSEKESPGKDATSRSPRTPIAPIVPVMAVVDDRGRLRRFAERAVAVAAAEKLGTDKYLSLATGRGASLQTREARVLQDKVEAEKRERARVKLGVSQRVMGALCCEVESRPAPSWWWAMQEPLVRLAGPLGLAYVAKRHAVDFSGDVVAGALRYADELNQFQFAGLALELMLAPSFALAMQDEDAPAVPESALPLLKEFGVNLKAIEAEVREEVRATSNVQRPTPNAQGDTSTSSRKRGK